MSVLHNEVLSTTSNAVAGEVALLVVVNNTAELSSGVLLTGESFRLSACISLRVGAPQPCI